ICGTTGDLDSEGWYAVAGWRVTRTLLPAVRYDTFLEDCSRGSSRQTNYTAGLTWQPVKYLRCQLDYTYEDFAARDVAGRNVVALMLSGIF
ncbi:MAG: porin, partial [Alistipes sp.]